MRTSCEVTVTLSLLVLIGIAAASECAAQETDPEGALALDSPIHNTFTRIHSADPYDSKDPKRARERWEWFVDQYRGHYCAARAEGRIIRYILFNQEKWEDVIRATPVFVKNTPEYVGFHGNVIYLLARMVNNRKLPDSTRRQAFDALVPLVKNSAWTLHVTHNYLSGLSIPLEEKYAIAKRADGISGRHSFCRWYVWQFLKRYADEGKPEDILRECELFVERYDDQSLENAEARKLVLSMRSKGGDADAGEELKKLNETEKCNREEVKGLFEKARSLSSSGAYGDALDTVRGLDRYPGYIHEPLWRTFLCESLAGCPADFAVSFFKCALKLIPSGTTAEQIYTDFIRGTGYFSPEAADTALEVVAVYFDRNLNDIMRDSHKLSFLVRNIPQVQANPRLKLKMYSLVARYAGRLGMRDVQAANLFYVGKHGWDLDREMAVESLDKAVAVCPGSPGAIGARWFLGALRGDVKVAQGPLPRPPSSLVSGPPDLSIPLPEPAAKASGIEDDNGRILLSRYDENENLVSRRAVRSTPETRDAALAVDGDPATAWVPGAVPAAILVPLKAKASVNRIVVRTKGKAYYTVSLLDRTGKTLSRYERDWSFWDILNRDSYWPPEDVTLRVLPVAGADFVRVEFYDRLEPSGGIREIEVYRSPYAARAVHIRQPQPVPADGRSIALSWNAEEPEEEIIYTADMECVRGFPIMRWHKPWLKAKRGVLLRQVGGNLGVEFFGTNATLMLSRNGGVDWQIDSRDAEKIDQPETGDKEYVLADNLEPGSHILRLKQRGLPPMKDTWGPDNIQFSGLRVKGGARVRCAVRFGSPGKWSSWYAMDGPSGSGMAVPEESPGKRARMYQVGLFFDTRAVQGRQTPVVESLSVSFPKERGRQDSGGLSLPTGSRLAEELDTVARLVQERKVVVAYAKNGTQVEYDAAQRIARKAGVYLVSDDIGLNNDGYPGLVVAVGVPRVHRHCRQLLAAVHLWKDDSFLNNQQGIVGILRDQEKKPKYLLVTAEHPSGVVRAAERLISRIEPYRKPKERFRLFTATELEMVYPWQLHPERVKPEKLSLQMGINDRRSLQMGITFNHAADDLQVTCGELVSDTGSRISSPQIRFVAFYEWVPFFGDLRLPDLLVERPELPIPENTATGVWFTVRTDKRTPSGVYNGTVSVRADGHEERVPLQVTVEPVELPDVGKVNVYSFAGVPWWFHAGSPEYERALRALAENEAEHGVDMLEAPINFSWKTAPNISPLYYALAKDGDDLEGVKWAVYDGQWKNMPQGEHFLCKFDRPVESYMLGAAFNGDKNTNIVVESYTNGKWTKIGRQTLEVTGRWGAMTFPHEGSQLEVVRVRTDGQKKFQVMKMRAFTSRKRKHLFTLDFSRLDRDMEIMEEVYRKRSLPLPTFLSHGPRNLPLVLRDVFGTGDWHKDRLELTFAEQLTEHMKQTDRYTRYMYKAGDEPGDIVRWTEMARPFKEGGLRTMTCHGIYKEIDVAVGVMDPWCPNYAHDIFLPFFRERQEKGDEFWWYCCGNPTTRITGKPIDNLPFYWLTAKWNLDGAMSYAALAMHESGVEGSAVPFRYDHGMGFRIAYLPDGTLLDTTRRELEADGIQDCRLINYIKERIKNRPDRQRQLEVILDSVVPYKYGYATKPEQWHTARKCLYDLARGLK